MSGILSINSICIICICVLVHQNALEHVVSARMSGCKIILNVTFFCVCTVQPLKSRNWVIFRLFKWNKYLHIDTTDQAKAKVEKKLNLWNFDHIIHYIMFNFLLSIIFCSFFNCLLACELIINRVICVVFNLWCENMSILYQ